MQQYNVFTFEQLCIRKETGFSFDYTSMYMPSNPSSFDDVIFKIISKIDTSLLLLDTHDEVIDSFTVIAIPLVESNSHQVKCRDNVSKNSSQNLHTLQDAWLYLAEEGWHGLQCISVLDEDSFPNNGSRRYSIYKYITCILDVVRANYMFHKFRTNFENETLEMFGDEEIKSATVAAFGLLWKRKDQAPGNIPLPVSVSRNLDSRTLKKKSHSPIKLVEAVRSNRFENNNGHMEVDDEISFQHKATNAVSIQEAVAKGPTRGRKNKTTNDHEDLEEPLPVSLNSVNEPTSKRGRKKKTVDDKEDASSIIIPGAVDAKSRRRVQHSEEHVPPPAVVTEKRGRRRDALADSTNGDIVVKETSTRGRKRTAVPEEEVDEPSKRPNEARGRKKIKSVTPPPEPQLDLPTPMDITLGFESSEVDAAAAKTSRKSMAARKSLSADWPESLRSEILAFFDDLNPEVSEQKRVALTCKYVAIQMDKDLPSKLLYQWVQKKGRLIQRSIKTFSVPEDRHKDAVLAFYRQLDHSKNTEAARLNFCLKYVETQHGIKISSKQLYIWLAEKPQPAKKTANKRR